MASAVLLSKFTATHHKHPATHRIHRLPHRLPSFNLRFTPCLPFSNLRLQTTIAKSSYSVIAIDHKKADASPIWVDAILKPLKSCAIPLVIMPLLLMSISNPARARACVWDTVNQVVTIDCALSEPDPVPKPTPKPLSMEDKVLLYGFMANCILLLIRSVMESVKAEEHDLGTTSVLKLQVGLSGQANPLQRGLNLVNSASSSVRRRVLKETTRALLCHPQYCISARSWVHIEAGINDGIMKLHQLYEEEQEKVKEGQRHNSTRLGAGGHNNDYIVVTIMVAALGDFTIPTIKESTDLINALQILQSIKTWRIKDLKVLWTPQAENNTIRENFLEVPILEASRKKNSMSAYLKSVLKKLDYAFRL